MISLFNRKKEKLANPNNIKISSILSFIAKSHLIQCKKYINKLKEFGLHLKNKSHFLFALILFDKSYNFFVPTM